MTTAMSDIAVYFHNSAHTMENAFYLQFANIHIYIIFFTRSIEPRGGK